MFGAVLKNLSMLPSGVYITLVLNSTQVMQILVIDVLRFIDGIDVAQRTAGFLAQHANASGYSKLRKGEFDPLEHVFFKTMGDDTLASHSSFLKFAGWTPEHLTETGRMMGHTLTAGDKSPVLAQKPFHDCEFVKSYPTYNPDVMRNVNVTGPESFLRCFYANERGPDWTHALYTSDCIENVLRQCMWFGKEVFDDMKERCSAYIEACSLPQPMALSLTYHDWVSKYTSQPDYEPQDDVFGNRDLGKKLMSSYSKLPFQMSSRFDEETEMVANMDDSPRINDQADAIGEFDLQEAQSIVPPTHTAAVSRLPIVSSTQAKSFMDRNFVIDTFTVPEVGGAPRVIQPYKLLLAQNGLADRFQNIAFLSSAIELSFHVIAPSSVSAIMMVSLITDSDIDSSSYEDFFTTYCQNSQKPSVFIRAGSDEQITTMKVPFHCPYAAINPFDQAMISTLPVVVVTYLTQVACSFPVAPEIVVRVYARFVDMDAFGATHHIQAGVGNMATGPHACEKCLGRFRHAPVALSFPTSFCMDDYEPIENPHRADYDVVFERIQLLSAENEPVENLKKFATLEAWNRVCGGLMLPETILEKIDEVEVSHAVSCRIATSFRKSLIHDIIAGNGSVTMPGLCYLNGFQRSIRPIIFLMYGSYPRIIHMDMAFLLELFHDGYLLPIDYKEHSLHIHITPRSGGSMITELPRRTHHVPLGAEKFSKVVGNIGEGLALGGEITGLAPMAMAGEVVAALGGLAHQLGYSKPQEPLLTEPSFCNAAGPQKIGVIATSRDQETTPFPLGTMDEMSFISVANRWSLIRNMKVTHSMVKGTELGIINVTPAILCNVGTNTTVPAACALPAMFHQYWRGTMEYKFVVNSPANVRCALMYKYDPIGLADPNSVRELAEDVVEHIVHEHGKQPDMQIDIGYSAPTPALNCLPGQGYTPTDYQREQFSGNAQLATPRKLDFNHWSTGYEITAHNGQLSITLHEVLSSGANQAMVVEVLVFARASTDMSYGAYNGLVPGMDLVYVPSEYTVQTVPDETCQVVSSPSQLISCNMAVGAPIFAAPPKEPTPLTTMSPSPKSPAPTVLTGAPSTKTPTVVPSSIPTTGAPTPAPTVWPTAPPSKLPTAPPTLMPTSKPTTVSPTPLPTSLRPTTVSPTPNPTQYPTASIFDGSGRFRMWNVGAPFTVTNVEGASVVPYFHTQTNVSQGELSLQISNNMSFRVLGFRDGPVSKLPIQYPSVGISCRVVSGSFTIDGIQVPTSTTTINLPQPWDITIHNVVGSGDMRIYSGVVQLPLGVDYIAQPLHGANRNVQHYHVDGDPKFYVTKALVLTVLPGDLLNLRPVFEQYGYTHVHYTVSYVGTIEIESYNTSLRVNSHTSEYPDKPSRRTFLHRVDQFPPRVRTLTEQSGIYMVITFSPTKSGDGEVIPALTESDFVGGGGTFVSLPLHSVRRMRANAATEGVSEEMTHHRLGGPANDGVYFTKVVTGETISSFRALLKIPTKLRSYLVAEPGTGEPFSVTFISPIYNDGAAYNTRTLLHVMMQTYGGVVGGMNSTYHILGEGAIEVSRYAAITSKLEHGFNTGGTSGMVIAHSKTQPITTVKFPVMKNREYLYARGNDHGQTYLKSLTVHGWSGSVRVREYVSTSEDFSLINFRGAPLFRYSEDL